MTGDLHQVPLSAPPINVQVRAKACGVPRAEQLRGTTGQTFRIAQQSDGLTTSWGDLATTERTFSPTIHTNTHERLRNSRTPSSQESGRSFRLIFESGLHTYLSVCWVTRGSQDSVIQSEHGNACCKRLSERCIDRASRVPASIQFSRSRTSPRRPFITTSIARKP